MNSLKERQVTDLLIHSKTGKCVLKIKKIGKIKKIISGKRVIKAEIRHHLRKYPYHTEEKIR